MTDSTKVVLRIPHPFDAPPGRVFDAWLDTAHVGEWLFATPGGQMVRVEIDARVGGRYTLVDRREGEDVEHTGEYLELERPRRLGFTLCVPKYSPEVDRIELDIAPAAGGGCTLTLTHATPPEWAESSREGWTMILDALERTLRS